MFVNENKQSTCPHCKNAYIQNITLNNITLTGHYSHLTEGMTINITVDGKANCYIIEKKFENVDENGEKCTTFHLKKPEKKFIIICEQRKNAFRKANKK
jgi:hypothetical protein